MMIGKSRPEYVFIRSVIAVLELVAPLSALYLVWSAVAPTRASFLPLVYASLEVAFFACVYLPRRTFLQKAVEPPKLTRDERHTLFAKCAAHVGPEPGGYPSGWFFGQNTFHRDNVVEWLLWALFSTTSTAWQGDAQELDEYVETVERLIGRPLEKGYNPDTPCIRLTLDPVRMRHRPLAWYGIVFIVDVVTCARLYAHGFRHYTDVRTSSFPPRLVTLFSRPSRTNLSYWYRPHRSGTPVLFLHGIGVGLFPYTGFLLDLAKQHPHAGIVVPEFLTISGRITPPPLSREALTHAIGRVLDTHALANVVVAAHSFGTGLYAQLTRTATFASRVSAVLLVDPIPILLHLPDVAFNFIYRTPTSANEWLLWYFASRDPDVARTLSRHFFWMDNVLWRDDLDRVDKVAVVLCGQDQLVNAEAVRRYLTGTDEARTYWRDGRLEVLCFPTLDHAMVFHTRKRWGRLLNVLDKFLRTE